MISNSTTATWIATLLVAATLGLGGTAGAQEPHWQPWQILLPFEHVEGETQIAPPHSPEDELKRMKLDGDGPDLEREHEGKLGLALRWAPLEGATAELKTPPIKFAEHLPSDSDSIALGNKVAAYLYRSVQCAEAIEVPVEFGSDDGCRVWLNGEIVHEVTGSRSVKQRSRVTLQFKSGTNHLLVKVANGGGAWGFQMLPRERLTPEAKRKLQPAINVAIEDGINYLLKTQQLDGSWGYQPRDYRNGQTSLSLYALLKSGVKPEHQAIRRGFEFLRISPPKKTYANAVQILALASTHRADDHKWIRKLAKQMMDWQQGDFAYPGGERDLSCTQYGAFAYWIAAQSGVKIPKRAWTDLVRSVLRYENRDGGFCYRPQQESTGAMTVAGLTVLAVCKQSLGDSYPRQYRKDLKAAEENGMRWLAENFEPDANPAVTVGKRERWLFYYLYSVERLAALLKVETFGAHDWYWEGAQFLVNAQGAEGEWGTTHGEPEPNTAFALLFLNRATASVSGPGASRAQGRHYATDETEALVVLRAKGDSPMSLWLSEVRPALLETHARTGANGEGLYLEAVEYLADGESIARVDADPTKPWSSQPYAAQHRFGSRGDHEVQLKLHFAEINGQRPEPALSPLLRVRVDASLEPWMLDYANDRVSNLVLRNLKSTEASSRRGDAKATGYVASKAFDGFQSTAWMSQPDDDEPALSATFKKPIRFDRIVLSHASSQELEQGDYDRATKVEIELSGKRDTLTLELDPSEFRKSVLVLDRATKTSELTIRVLERLSGVKHKGIVGFAEIELRLGEEKAKKR